MIGPSDLAPMLPEGRGGGSRKNKFVEACPFWRSAVDWVGSTEPTFPVVAGNHQCDLGILRRVAMDDLASIYRDKWHSQCPGAEAGSGPTVMSLPWLFRSCWYSWRHQLEAARCRRIYRRHRRPTCVDRADRGTNLIAIDHTTLLHLTGGGHCVGLLEPAIGRIFKQSLSDMNWGAPVRLALRSVQDDSIFRAVVA